MTIQEFITKYKGAFPDVHGRTLWKTWGELAEDMKKDLLEIADKSFDAGCLTGRVATEHPKADKNFIKDEKAQYLSELSGNTEQLKEKNQQL